MRWRLRVTGVVTVAVVGVGRVVGGGGRVVWLGLSACVVMLVLLGLSVCGVWGPRAGGETVGEHHRTPVRTASERPERPARAPTLITLPVAVIGLAPPLVPAPLSALAAAFVFFRRQLVASGVSRSLLLCLQHLRPMAESAAPIYGPEHCAIDLC